MKVNGPWRGLVHSWILTSRQPHRVTSGGPWRQKWEFLEAADHAMQHRDLQLLQRDLLLQRAARQLDLYSWTKQVVAVLQQVNWLLYSDRTDSCFRSDRCFQLRKSIIIWDFDSTDIFSCKRKVNLGLCRHRYFQLQKNKFETLTPQIFSITKV